MTDHSIMRLNQPSSKSDQHKDVISAMNDLLSKQPSKDEAKTITFEEERIKDAVNFKNLAQTMAKSNGFVQMQERQQSTRVHNDFGTLGPKDQPTFDHYLNIADPVFQNFSKNQRDEWLLNSSHKSGK